MSTPHPLQFFTRDDCHLCELMEAALSPWIESKRIVLVHCDVDSCYQWFERYDLRVPILANDKVVICEGKLNPNVLNRYLKSETENDPGGLHHADTYQRVFALVAQIGPGYVTTYGHIAALEGRVVARDVGNAMASLPSNCTDVPWQRVINADGQISERTGSNSASQQRQRLEAEEVLFDPDSRVDFVLFGWDGPDWDWLDSNGYYSASPPTNSNKHHPNTLHRYPKSETEKSETENDPAELHSAGTYQRVFALVAQIAPGYVTTYGHIAALEGRVMARYVGNVMASLPSHRTDVPWQRVINADGRISERAGGSGASQQRQRLEAEGVLFDPDGRVDFDRFGWDGPDWGWLDRNGYYPVSPPINRNKRRK